VHRTTVLLNFLAEHSGDSFTLSHLAAELNFNKTTTQTMLAELSAARFVVMDPATRAYRLGPAVIRLGSAAAGNARASLAVAEPYLMALRDRYEVSCVATTLTGGDLVNIGRFDHARIPAGSMRIDDLIPAIPPVGRAFVAWADQPTINAWLARLGDAADAQRRAEYAAMLSVIRRRGYILNRETGMYARLGELAARLRKVQMPSDLHEIIDGLQDAVAEQAADHTAAIPRSMSAPVFDPAGRVLMTLSTVNFPASTTRETLAEQLHALLLAAAEVTSAIGGRHPGPDPLKQHNPQRRISEDDFDDLFVQNLISV